MTFKQRLPYFLVGLTIGIILVVFVFGKKGTSFNYLPNARVLKDINKKERLYSDAVLLDLVTYKIDTATVSLIINSGDIDFSTKEKLEDGCTNYMIEGSDEYEAFTLKVMNCETTATVTSISKK